MKSIFSLALLASLLATAVAPVQAQSRRAGTSEIYLSPYVTVGNDRTTFEGGTTAYSENSLGLAFGWAHNLNQHFSAGLDMAWSYLDYVANVRAGPGNPNPTARVAGSLDTFTMRLVGNYNLFAGNFTPFVTGGVGFTYIDTNIPSGLPDTLCWYYPWVGQYCAAYVPTHTTTKFSYNAGAGLRLDAGQNVFRLLVNQQFADIRSGYHTSWTQIRIDFGMKF